VYKPLQSQTGDALECERAANRREVRKGEVDPGVGKADLGTAALQRLSHPFVVQPRKHQHPLLTEHPGKQTVGLHDSPALQSGADYAAVHDRGPDCPVLQCCSQFVLAPDISKLQHSRHPLRSDRIHLAVITVNQGHGLVHVSPTAHAD